VEEYNEVITSARDQVLSDASDLPVEQIAAVLAAVRNELPARELTAAELKRRYNRAFQQLQDDLTSHVQQQRQQAAEETADAHEEALLAAAAALGVAAVSFSAGPAQQDALEGDQGDSAEELVRRSLQDAADDASDVIDSALGEEDGGEDGGEITEDLTSTQATDVADAVTSALAGDELQEALSGAGMDVDPGGTSLENNLKRTVAHEVARAADEAGKTIAARSPAVDLIEWTLSGRHHSLRSSPDSCDVLAEADLHGFGEGLYHPSTAPVLPHPWCECRQRVVVHDPEDWGSQREIPSRPTIEGVQGQMEQIGGDKTITDRYAANQRSQLDRAFRLAHESPR
jgi:phage gp36-like protein